MTQEQKKELETILKETLDKRNAATSDKRHLACMMFIRGVEKTLNIMGYSALYNPLDDDFQIVER